MEAAVRNRSVARNVSVLVNYLDVRKLKAETHSAISRCDTPRGQVTATIRLV